MERSAAAATTAAMAPTARAPAPGGGHHKRWIVVVVLLIGVILFCYYWFFYRPARMPTALETPPAAGGASGAASANLLLNGTFAADAIPNGDWADNTNITGWLPSARTVLARSDSVTWTAVPNPSGSNWCVLYQRGAYCAQSVTGLRVGATYRVTATAVQRPFDGAVPGPALAVYIDDVALPVRVVGGGGATVEDGGARVRFAAANRSVAYLEGAFAATKPTHVVKFANATESGDDLSVLVSDAALRLQTA